MMNDCLKIALFQYDIIWENKKENKSKILKILSDFYENVDWLVFPEMTLTGFTMNKEKSVLEKSDIDFFKSIAAQFDCFVTFGGNLSGNNCSITLTPKGCELNLYEKNHLFSFANENINYREGRYVDCFDILDYNVSPAICYDLRFPYHFWNNAVNTDVFTVIASWPSSRDLHWKALLRARAIENQAYVIAVNRTGLDPFNEYVGNSMIIDPLGDILLECHNNEGVFVGAVDKSKVSSIRCKFPFLNDRKVK